MHNEKAINPISGGEESAAIMIMNWSQGLSDAGEFELDQMSPLGKPLGELTGVEFNRIAQVFKAFANDPMKTLSDGGGCNVENQLYLCRDDLRNIAMRKLAAVVGTDVLAHWLTASIMVTNMRRNTKGLLTDFYTLRHETMVREIEGRLTAK